MKNKFTILGCGSSLGSPWITNYKGNLKKDIKNIRTRCCAHIQKGNLSVLIDTSPDIKYQILKNKINSLDAIIYTHEHADQTSGIFEMRPFYWKNKKNTSIWQFKNYKRIKKKYTFCFKSRHGYKPIMKTNIIKKNFSIKKKDIRIHVKSFEVEHGLIKSSAYIVDKIAYISDCNRIPKNSLKDLFGLNFLILDCLRNNKHPSHFYYDEAVNLAKILKPKKTILTNLHIELDYFTLKKKLPKNIIPAYDGLSFEF